MNDDASVADIAVLECRQLRKAFVDAGQTLEVLRGVDMRICRGDLTAIIGASGSGKTTLLQLLGGLDRPTAGSIRVLDTDLARMDENARGRLRNRSMGFVYQFHHLLPEFSALENVAMPLLVGRVDVATAAERAAALLERVGLGGRLNHRPGQLSGGERQRAAVARALITRPALVLADEPTGNLDSRNGAQVFEIMLELNRELGTSLVLVTHDERIARRMDRVLVLKDGLLRQAD
jgi:lipoprotein-releasing system ATP-binding protein